MDEKYKVKPQVKVVGIKEFRDFIQSYPRMLDIDKDSATGTIIYNDYSICETQPVSVIASWNYESDSGKIVTNYEEIYQERKEKF